ncbi:MAG: DUF3459 domain-containing protein, partial [Candidatus Bathyarchaeota archaeon]
NHDQVGNRALGDRFYNLVPVPMQRLAAATTIFSPYIPLIFMGEEYSEKAPFIYFTSHSDPQLVENVRVGRKNEFATFDWKGEIPDPQDPETFERSKVNLKLRFKNKHSQIFKFYKDMIAIRKTYPAFLNYNKQHIKVEILKEKVLTIQHKKPKKEVILILLSFNDKEVTVQKKLPKGKWSLIFNSENKVYGGSENSKVPERLYCRSSNIKLTLSPFNVLLYHHRLS